MRGDLSILKEFLVIFLELIFNERTPARTLSEE